ncbi:MAG: HEAT repeat domain-containing protein [Methylovulum sp.]|nr:HEAT repeat domain-containing protein [Methylovulum sp.]
MAYAETVAVDNTAIVLAFLVVARRDGCCLDVCIIEVVVIAGKFWVWAIAGLLCTPMALMAEDSNIRYLMGGDAGAELQLKVRQAPLAQALNAVADKTGMVIHYSGLPESLFTLSCIETTVTEILHCLLDKNADLIFRYVLTPSKDDQPRPLAELWVLGRRFEVEPGLMVADVDTVTDTQIRGMDGMEKLLETATAENPQYRADAVAQLAARGEVQNPAIHKALDAALSDENAEVRAQAVSGLAKGQDMAAVLQSALQDSDVSVRLMAVDNAGNDAGLLQQALGDSDETVREFAALKLAALAAP